MTSHAKLTIVWVWLIQSAIIRPLGIADIGHGRLTPGLASSTNLQGKEIDPE